MSEFQDAYNAGSRAAYPTNHTAPNGQTFLVRHKDTVADPMPLARPTHIERNVDVGDVGSFVEYFERYQREQSIIGVYLDKYQGYIKGIIDYHSADWTPGFCQHSVRLEPRHSDQWLKWSALDNVEVSQETFAEFVEDNYSDFASPDAATMLEIATTIAVNSNVNYRKAVRLHNGQVQLQYNQNVEGRACEEGRIEIPTEIQIGLSPFVGSLTYGVKLRLRYRLTNGEVKFRFKAINAAEVLVDAFNGIEDAIVQQIDNVLVVRNKRL